MDKITRIHIARVPYEISAAGQERLHEYLSAIRNALDPSLADDIMADIEARITEILNERGIKKNDVITSKDVKAVEERLGSPEQFAGGKEPKEPDDKPKKLLRDMEGAYVGGVAAGLGRYFDIDPLFIRLAFVALTFISGIGIIAYIVCWLLMPAAKTSSDKLQMAGRPVTIATLQRYRAVAAGQGPGSPSPGQKVVHAAARAILLILKIVFSIWASLAILALLVGLGIATSTLFVDPFHAIVNSYRLDYIAVGLVWLTAISLIGLLVTALVAVWKQHARELKYGVLIFLPLTIAALAATGATGVFVANHFGNEYGNGKLVKPLAVTGANAQAAPTKLNVQADRDLNLTYVVSNGPIHATYLAYPGLGRPDLTITDANGTFTVSAADLAKAAPNCFGRLCRQIYLPVQVTLYGPAPTEINAPNGAQVNLSNANFNQPLSVSAADDASVSLNNDTMVELMLSASGGSIIQAGSSSAQNTTAAVDSTSQVGLPATASLSATIPSDCTATGNQPLSLTSQPGQTTINGVLQTATSLSANSCVQFLTALPPPQPPKP